MGVKFRLTTATLFIEAQVHGALAWLVGNGQEYPADSQETPRYSQELSGSENQ